MHLTVPAVTRSIYPPARQRPSPGKTVGGACHDRRHAGITGCERLLHPRRLRGDVRGHERPRVRVRASSRERRRGPRRRRGGLPRRVGAAGRPPQRAVAVAAGHGAQRPASPLADAVEAAAAGRRAGGCRGDGRGVRRQSRRPARPRGRLRAPLRGRSRDAAARRLGRAHPPAGRRGSRLHCERVRGPALPGAATLVHPPRRPRSLRLAALPTGD